MKLSSPSPDGTSCFSRSERLVSSQTWDDWIASETRRRYVKSSPHSSSYLTSCSIVCLWFVICHVVAARFGVACPSYIHYQHLPLASSKILWEARSEEEWEEENTLHIASSPISTLGELMAAKKRSDIPLNAKRLQAWEAGADKLGMLLNIVTTFLLDA